MPNSNAILFTIASEAGRELHGRTEGASKGGAYRGNIRLARDVRLDELFGNLLTIDAKEGKTDPSLVYPEYTIGIRPTIPGMHEQSTRFGKA